MRDYELSKLRYKFLLSFKNKNFLLTVYAHWYNRILLNPI